jgi:hypothetical protein
VGSGRALESQYGLRAELGRSPLADAVRRKPDICAMLHPASLRSTHKCASFLWLALISGFLRIRLKCDFYVFINRVDFEFPPRNRAANFNGYEGCHADIDWNCLNDPDC